MSDTPAVLILTAVTAETKPIARALHARPDGSLHRHALTYRSNAPDRSVFIAATGVGPVRAHRVCRALLEALKPDWLIAAGLAGAANPALVKAQVIVPQRVICEQGPVYLPSHTRLGDSWVLRTSEHLICRACEKTLLHREHGVDAVDMETAAIAAAAQERGIRWTCVRSISDTADESLPHYLPELTLPDGRPDAWAVARALLLHPHHTPALVRLGQSAARAAGALADRMPEFIDTILA